ncbi:GNAT family N-acetyltransferase [soil metagenome]
MTRIAFAAKRHWGYPERWIEAWRNILTITPAYIARNEVYAGTVNDEAIAFYALTSKGGVMDLGHLWVQPEYMGFGIGRALFEHALCRTASRGAGVLEIESDPSAEGFYLRMGARRIGETISDVCGQRRVLPLLVADVLTE